MATILVVDDDEVLGRALELGLSRAGHRVVPAADGEEALRLYRSEPIDLVLTDVIMPGKEGVELMMELRRTVPRPRVIAMSGGGSVGSHTYLGLARRLGAAATLAKPFALRQLIETVESVLAGPIPSGPGAA